RAAGLNIDILPPDQPSYEGYKLIFAPGLLHLDAAREAALWASGATLVLGPRTGLKTPELSIALPLGPGIEGLDARVTQVESLPPAHPILLPEGGAIWKWFEHLEGTAPAKELTADGQPVLVGTGKCHYLAGWPDPDAMARIVRRVAEKAGLTPMALPEGLRVRDTDQHRFWINYGAAPVTFEGRTIGAADILWEEL
ncbi:MAG: beta-galactosidase trimerization domain-containing protein, partial [Pseudomonadota bacterium]